MNEIVNSMSHLTKQVVDKRIAGYTIEEIADEMQIDVVDVVRAWTTYVETRNEIPWEEAWVLHLLRLEGVLKKASDRINYAAEAEDFDVVLKTLDHLEKLQGLNMKRKSEAEEEMLALTRQQTQLILSAMFSLQSNFKMHLERAFAENSTIKGIKAQIIGEYETVFVGEATKALSKVGEH